MTAGASAKNPTNNLICNYFAAVHGRRKEMWSLVGTLWKHANA